jgi:hypothetical protein
VAHVDPTPGGAPYGAPIPPAPVQPGTGGIGRSWLLLGGIGCGCVGTMALGAIIALAILVIGPAFRGERIETASAPTAAPSSTRVATPTTAATRPVAATSAPAPETGEAPTSTLGPPTNTPAPTPTAATPVPTPAPARPVARPGQRPALPGADERVQVDGAVVGVLGLTTIDEDGKLATDNLGQTTFGTEQRGIGAAFVLEAGPAEGILSLAGVWVTRQGQRLTPLADPATLEVSSIDESQPLLFRLTFRSGAIPSGDYAFGLFTVQNGQIDRLVKRLDFTVE